MFYSIGSAAISTSNVKPRSTPNVEHMSYILKTKDKNVSVPLNEPEKLWSLSEFNPNLPLVMVITGWSTNFNDTENSALDVIWPAYRCRGNVNFVVSNKKYLTLKLSKVQEIFLTHLFSPLLALEY